jgi:hypothetical protein
MRRITMGAALLLSGALLGCDSKPAAPAPAETPAAPAPTSESPTIAPTAPPGEETPAQPASETPTPTETTEPAAPAPTDGAATPPAEEIERVKAETGVGAKGRDYGGGVITEPVRQYFRAPQMVAFNVQIPHALQLWEATNGRSPASHEEFMQEIIAANQIKLPELPPGERYVYDPEKKELFVERPKK